ncbi:beta-1,6-N-acetylglucosaminyltransferase [Thermodesulfobacteriota bacterium]
MKTAYLILAHNNPAHLQELVDALQTDHSACFVHIDKKPEIGNFQSLHGPHVSFTNQRISVHWGDFSTIEATLVLIRQALEDPLHFQRMVLLSGTDYPLRSAWDIESFFRRYPRDEFINIVKMPASRERKPMWRLTTPRFSSPQDPFITTLIRKIGVRIGIGKFLRTRSYRKHFKQLTPYAGDQWWALTRDACLYILNFIEKEHGIYKFFRYTRLPDEMFFQIILGNSVFRVNMRRNLTYVDWGRDIISSHPAWITEDHLDNLFDSDLSFDSEELYGQGPIFFARKFSDEHGFLIDEVKRHIDHREKNKHINHPNSQTGSDLQI